MITKALKFASEKHFGQKRKVSGLPYIVHPVMVSYLVQKYKSSERMDELVQKVPRDRFEGADELEVGMRFHASSDHGETLVTITDVSDDEVTVDGNHPLAGQTLHFDVKVVDVRDASAEEVEHGHIHGPGGHDH